MRILQKFLKRLDRPNDLLNTVPSITIRLIQPRRRLPPRRPHLNLPRHDVAQGRSLGQQGVPDVAGSLQRFLHRLALLGDGEGGGSVGVAVFAGGGDGGCAEFLSAVAFADAFF